MGSVLRTRSCLAATTIRDATCPNDICTYICGMSSDTGGYRKDGKKRRKLTLSVTEESIAEARKIDPRIGRAFEKVFKPKKPNA